MSSPSAHPQAVHEAFLAHEREERLNTGKVAAFLVVALMPVGVTLDYFVYPERVGYFFLLRVICSLLAVGLWYLHTTEFGARHYKWLGLPIAFLPAFFIVLMIYDRDTHTSPYYAGLNLVLLAVSAVVHWSVVESFVAVFVVLGMYGAACLLKGPIEEPGILFNNFYFLVLTGVIVVVGNAVFNRLRYQEFMLRFELDQKRGELEESNRKLLELDEMKNRFFANISHELRTPLTLLIAPLETIIARYGPRFDAETREMLATMHANAMRLLKLINDLLALVRLESGRVELKPEPVHVDEFVKGVASAANQLAKDKGIRFTVEVGPEVGVAMLDRDKIEKVLLNLVFNALKFTPSGGSVTVTVHRQDDQLVLAVTDTGVGISRENLKNVFSRFWQADASSTRKYQGVGIGLALVKELVNVHRGEVAVDSEEGKGTTFTVRLPYEPAELPEAPAEPVSAPEPAAVGQAGGAPETQGTVSSEEWLANLYRRADLFPVAGSRPEPEVLEPSPVGGNGGGRHTILVADDEPDMRRFIKSQLAKRYNVIEAVDGLDALEKAEQLLPDLVLLDMMMPHKDGLEVCAELRQQEQLQNVPIIMLTAKADEETKFKALSTGANDFLPKPFSTTELEVRVKNLLESLNYQRKLRRQNELLAETIEKLKETEAQLVQSEKLASLGRLSAGIIHEINNPLNFAATGLYTLRNLGRRLGPEEQAEYVEVLKDVEEGLQRVRSIVSDLRSFAHDGGRTEAREQVDVTELATLALRFVNSELRKHHVRVEQRLTENQAIWANKNRLVQVLVNLLQNAVDAMKTKTYPEQEEPTVTLESRVEDGKSLLIVRDNGPGIAPENLSKIFDPFFTTKDVGEGMGLGLSICYRIVKEYDGQIRVQSEPGRFCEFTLEFPVKGEL